MMRIFPLIAAPLLLLSACGDRYVVAILEAQTGGQGGSANGGAGSGAAASGGVSVVPEQSHCASLCALPSVCLADSCVSPRDGRSVVAGTSSTCVLLKDGGVACWGEGANGQLGAGNVLSSFTPQRVPRLSSIVEVSGDAALLVCALDQSKVLRCWGHNGDGALGTGDKVDRATPTPVGVGISWLTVRVGSGQSCALDEQLRAYCWGHNADGELGTGDRRERLVPSLVSGGHRFASIAVGWGHSCGITVDGALWCWGQNTLGQLGLGDRDCRTVPTRVGSERAQRILNIQGQHSCVVRTGGALWCWGYNRDGQLGLGDARDRDTPTLVRASGVMGLGLGRWTSCLIDAAQELSCAGDLLVSDIGVTGAKDQLSFKPIPGHLFAETHSGYVHHCARDADGALWCWGDNGYGQLGTGDTGVHIAPTLVDLSGL